MKHLFAFFLAVTLLLSCAGCVQRPTDFVDAGDGLRSLTRNGVTVTVDPQTGMLKSVKTDYDALTMDGVMVDAGIDGASLFNQIGYKDISGLSTWELPLLYLRPKEPESCAVNGVYATAQGFDVALTRDRCTVTYHYTILENGLSLTAELSTASDAPLTVNGVGFMVKGLEGFDFNRATFEFPGSTPAGRIPFAGHNKFKATTADYAAPAIQITDGSRTANILYVNDTEKWTAGCWYDMSGLPCAGFQAAAEGYVAKNQNMEVGTLYLPLRRPEADPYRAISEFWAQLGYHTPTDSSAADDLYAIYSGHPYGTMDTNYFNRWTLAEYASQLPGIAAMGFDAIWLLPVFQHTGDNVYEPIDEAVIDKRYGGLEQAAFYIETAHAQNMKVLFDFVPHGPRPSYPFAKEHNDWISKNQAGENQIEWGCVSMDYNHPEYAQYMKELSAYYAKEIGLDGARIDCSMGGLSNWHSATGLRASAAGLGAGIQVVKSIRNGFLAGEKQVLLLPENFHPTPAYAPYTDVFYDMPLYRCLYDLNQQGLSETEYVSRLCHFLDAEGKTSVAGQKKLRFLGNHDTVTWTFDAQRAQTLYGTEKARALWMAMGWIDGVLYIYQGDEDPAAYHLNGENLTGFFTELIAAKSSFLPAGYRTEYVETGSPIMAFYRCGEDSESARLCLVNLSAEPQTYTLRETAEPLAAIGGYTLSGDQITLEPYAGVILDSAYPG